MWWENWPLASNILKSSILDTFSKMSLLLTGCCIDPIVLMSCQDSGTSVWSAMRTLVLSSNSGAEFLLQEESHFEEFSSLTPVSLGFVGFLGVCCSSLHPRASAEKNDVIKKVLGGSSLTFVALRGWKALAECVLRHRPYPGVTVLTYSNRYVHRETASKIGQWFRVCCCPSLL